MNLKMDFFNLKKPWNEIKWTPILRNWVQSGFIFPMLPSIFHKHPSRESLKSWCSYWLWSCKLQPITFNLPFNINLLVTTKNHIGFSHWLNSITFRHSDENFIIALYMDEKTITQFLTRDDYVVQVVKAWKHYFTYNMFSNFGMYL
jgi:hypothetical protein